MKGRNFVNPSRTPARPASLLYGIHPITEWIRQSPARVRVLRYLRDVHERAAVVVRLAATAGIVTQPCDATLLRDLAGTARHQGLVAEVGPFPYTEMETVLARAPRLLVLGDQLQDPQNLGALLRTAQAFGASAVIVPKDASAPVTARVEVAAAGAAALVPVCRVTNLSRALKALKAEGFWVVGLATRGGQSLFSFVAPDRLVLVLGGETGMRRLVAAQCDFHVSIPMCGEMESLNAAVAAAVSLYEVRRQWLAP